MKPVKYYSCFVSAFNGSLISSLTSPTLSKPLETFEEIFKKSSHLEIMTQKNTATEQFMASGLNKILKKLLDVSEKTHSNVNADTDVAMSTVLNNINKVFFSDMADFSGQINPPSGNVAGALLL